MNSNKYANLENQYKFFAKKSFECVTADLADKIVAEDLGKPVPNDPERDEYIIDQVYLYKGIALQILTKMYMDCTGSFEYYDEMIRNLNWFMDMTCTRANKGYDQYIISHILLTSECAFFWEKELKKNYKFLIRKIHNVKNIMYWTIRFNTIAINDGLHNLANSIINNAINVLECEDTFSPDMCSYLENRYIET